MLVYREAAWRGSEAHGACARTVPTLWLAAHDMVAQMEVALPLGVEAVSKIALSMRLETNLDGEGDERRDGQAEAEGAAARGACLGGLCSGEAGRAIRIESTLDEQSSAGHLIYGFLNVWIARRNDVYLGTLGIRIKTWIAPGRGLLPQVQMSGHGFSIRPVKVPQEHYEDRTIATDRRSAHLSFRC